MRSQQRFILVVGVLVNVVALAILSPVLSRAHVLLQESEPPVADAFDFPLGAPDGGGYIIVADYGIQNPYLDDRETCFEDLDGTHPDPAIDKYEGDHIGWREVYHAGADWISSSGGAATADTDVTAVSSGVVVWVDDPGGWPGSAVVISHTLPNGQIVSSAYLHLERYSVEVSVGDTVQRGQKIATVYNDGDNSHLHWEVRRFVNGGEHLFQDSRRIQLLQAKESVCRCRVHVSRDTRRVGLFQP